MTTSVRVLTFVTRQKKLPSSSGITGGVKMVVACAAVASTTASTPAIRNLRKRLIVHILRARIAQYRFGALQKERYLRGSGCYLEAPGWYGSRRRHGGKIGAVGLQLA